jgi:hypothetical protein
MAVIHQVGAMARHNQRVEAWVASSILIWPNSLQPIRDCNWSFSTTNSRCDLISVCGHV